MFANGEAKGRKQWRVRTEHLVLLDTPPGGTTGKGKGKDKDKSKDQQPGTPKKRKASDADDGHGSCSKSADYSCGSTKCLKPSSDILPQNACR